MKVEFSVLGEKGVESEGCFVGDDLMLLYGLLE